MKSFDRFEGIIFCGNCGCGCTNAQIVHLHKLLDESISHISGMQQGGEEMNWLVEKNAKEIFLALTGKKIKKDGLKKK